MITADVLTGIRLFAAVPESERNSIAARAADVSVRPGEFVIREGEPAAFFALLSGRMSAHKRVGGGDQSRNGSSTGFHALTWGCSHKCAAARVSVEVHTATAPARARCIRGKA